MRKTASIDQSPAVKQHTLALFFQAIRVQQWSKNLLLFVPLFTAHRFANFALLLDCFIAFFAFGLCASAGYIFNDLLDIESDRRHPRKKDRPFASGALSISAGMGMIPVFLFLSALLSYVLLPQPFMFILILYFILTVSYSLFIKKTVLIDVILLSLFYTLRIIAGAEAIQVDMSFWLFAFSVTLFLSLAYVKRYSELIMVKENGEQKASGRGYKVQDADQLKSLGTASGYLAVLVFAFYINSDKVATLYSSPKLLWLACPFVLYWISRIWLLTNRGEISDDPLFFALRDKTSHAVVLIVLLIMYLAI